MGVTLPVRQGVSGLVAGVGGFAAWFGDVQGLAGERDELAVERNELLARLAELEGVERENESLRRQLGADKALADRDYVVARMSGQLNQGGVNLLLIDKGSVDGVEEGAVVMVDGVMVGRVRKVAAHSATVQPPQSLGSVIPIVIHYGGQVTKGVVEGSYNLTARLTQVLPDERLEQGSTIVTSGEGGTYPANLVVGKVGAVDNRDNQVFQSAEVELLWRVDELESVLVLRRAQ